MARKKMWVTHEKAGRELGFAPGAGGCSTGAGRGMVPGAPIPRCMRMLLVAADAMEFRGVARRTASLQPVPIAVDWARTGRLGGNDVLLVANGAGWKRAAAAADAGIAHFAPGAVVSTGFCGALDQGLKIGGYRGGERDSVRGPLACGRGSDPRREAVP